MNKKNSIFTTSFNEYMDLIKIKGGRFNDNKAQWKQKGGRFNDILKINVNARWKIKEWELLQRKLLKTSIYRYSKVCFNFLYYKKWLINIKINKLKYIVIIIIFIVKFVI